MIYILTCIGKSQLFLPPIIILCSNPLSIINHSISLDGPHRHQCSQGDRTRWASVGPQVVSLQWQPGSIRGRWLHYKVMAHTRWWTQGQPHRAPGRPAGPPKACVHRGVAPNGRECVVLSGLRLSGDYIGLCVLRCCMLFIYLFIYYFFSTFRTQ